MQIEHQPIESVTAGTEIAIKVKEEVRRGDRIYKVKEA
jgi:hypothetical protein